MDEHVYRDMYEQEERHWWFRGRRAVIWALLHRGGVRPTVELLDAGCGTGRHLIEYGVLGPSEGVDPFPAAVAACHERGLGQVVQGEIEELPYADARFGLVLATDVLEHLDDDAAALAELRRVTRPGGALLVTVPALMWLWSKEDVSLHHRRRYRRGELVRKVRDAGFEPVLATYFNTILLPPIALGRRLADRRDSATRGSRDGAQLRAAVGVAGLAHARRGRGDPPRRAAAYRRLGRSGGPSAMTMRARSSTMRGPARRALTFES